MAVWLEMISCADSMSNEVQGDGGWDAIMKVFLKQKDNHVNSKGNFLTKQKKMVKKG